MIKTFTFCICLLFCILCNSTLCQDCLTLQRQVKQQNDKIIELNAEVSRQDILISNLKKREADIQLKYELCNGEITLIDKEKMRLTEAIKNLNIKIVALKGRIAQLEKDTKQLANQIAAKDSLIQSEERLIAFYRDQDTLNSITIKNLEWQNKMRSLEIDSVVLENYKNQAGILFFRFNLASKSDIGIQPNDSVLIKITVKANVNQFQKNRDEVTVVPGTQVVTVGASGSKDAIFEQLIYVKDFTQKLIFKFINGGNSNGPIFTKRKIRNNKYSIQVYCIIKDRQTLIGTKYITWENINHH